MTHVLTLEELHQVVPSVRSLEGKNFKDFKETMAYVVKEIEKDGNWDFVQYIQNKPSLFIIREKTKIVSLEDVSNIASDVASKVFENNIVSMPTTKRSSTPSKGNKPTETTKIPEPVLESVPMPKTKDSGLFTKDNKYPW